ncbi:hypothetical protein EJ06DRAFT_25380 [Trichodelitschia bisporula]|uniref:Uncharacterized protein n=1 Tax=Trichodelitschia bisporula TaxID=703511 RepID=A0A6G1IBH3_9PEZI|nr:hypothetical protein EJ06DRAFT_25380 [Trichodelitschia bisporula]
MYSMYSRWSQRVPADLIPTQASSHYQNCRRRRSPFASMYQFIRTLLVMCAVGLAASLPQPKHATASLQIYPDTNLVHARIPDSSGYSPSPLGLPSVFRAKIHKVRQAKSQPPEWQDNVCRGRKLISIMKAATLEEAAASNGGRDLSTPWKDINDETLTKYGWTLREQRMGTEVAGVGERKLQSDLGIQGVSPMGLIAHHNNPWTDDAGVKRKETYGIYQDIFNPAFGLIVAVIIEGPSYRAEEYGLSQSNVPPLKQWADFAHLLWIRQCEAKGVDPKGLRYVIQENIENEETVALMNWAVYSTGQKFRGWKDRGPIYFSADSDEGAALIGSANGRGTAWLLAQHKDTLGHKTITRVAVFLTDVDGDKDYRSYSSKMEDIQINALYIIENV